MEIMIKKKVMTELGIEAEIWKVGYISLDRVNKYGSVTMCLYFTETAEQYIKSVVDYVDENDDKNVSYIASVAYDTLSFYIILIESSFSGLLRTLFLRVSILSSRSALMSAQWESSAAISSVKTKSFL